MAERMAGFDSGIINPDAAIPRSDELELMMVDSSENPLVRAEAITEHPLFVAIAGLQPAKRDEALAVLSTSGRSAIRYGAGMLMALPDQAWTFFRRGSGPEPDKPFMSEVTRLVAASVAEAGFQYGTADDLPRPADIKAFPY